MPQMSPIMWDFMVINSFIFTLVLMNKMYFYMKDSNGHDSIITENKTFEKNNFNWLW